MATQTVRESISIFSPVLHDPDPRTIKPLRVSPQDLNFEIDEEQLAAELRAQLLYNRVDHILALIDVEELANVYQQQFS